MIGKAYEWLVEYAHTTEMNFHTGGRDLFPIHVEVNKEYKLINKRVKYEEPCDGRLSSTVPREGRVKLPPLTRRAI